VHTIKNARINQIQNDASQNITESIDKASKNIKTRTTQAIIGTKDKMIEKLDHSTQENTMKHKQELESTGKTIIDQIESLLTTAKEHKEEREQDFIKRMKTAMDKITKATATALNDIKNAPEKNVDTHHLRNRKDSLTHQHSP
jgi:phage-related minor tail protein